MGRMIIDNRSDKVSDYEALSFVQQVVAEGRISNDGKQYCYVMAFTNKSTGDKYMVSTDLNKSSDRFVVYDGAST